MVVMEDPRKIINKIKWNLQPIESDPFGTVSTDSLVVLPGAIDV